MQDIFSPMSPFRFRLYDIRYALAYVSRNYPTLNNVCHSGVVLWLPCAIRVKSQLLRYSY